MFERLRQLLSRPEPAPQQPQRKLMDRVEYELAPAESVRRWESAKTHRLNAAHWACVSNWSGHSINDDLRDDLETLVARCNYEIQNNPMVEGVVTTHAADVSGQRGPMFKCYSSNERYNDALEAAVKEFMEAPDVSGQVCGVDMIQLWIRQLWTYGSFVNQLVSTERENGFQLALRFIDPRRKSTPYGMANDPNVAFGTRYSMPNYAPESYYIRSPRTFGGGSSDWQNQWQTLPAEVIQHRYQHNEPDQLEGYPLLASALDAIADIRDYDAEVMTAARSAAAQAMFWYAEDGAAQWLDLPESEQWTGARDIQRGMQQTGPPGWKPMMLNSTQPQTGYIDYRHERLREIGRPVHMPLMKVLLSSEKQNFSSAHYDDQVYVRSGVKGYQTWLEKTTLNQLVKVIELEVRLGLGMSQPRTVDYQWTWEAPAYVNPKDYYEALRMRLEDGTATYRDVLAAYGKDVEQTIEERAKINELLEDAGLERLPINFGNFQPTPELVNETFDVEPPEPETPEIPNADQNEPASAVDQ